MSILEIIICDPALIILTKIVIFLDETSKAGLEKTFDNNKDYTNEVHREENRSVDATATEPVAGPSGVVRLNVRKDLFEDTNEVDIVASMKIGDTPNNPNCNRSYPSNSSLIENDSKCDTPADKESGGTSKVVNVPPPHDECNDNQLREVVVPSPPGKLMLPTYFAFQSIFDNTWQKLRQAYCLIAGLLLCTIEMKKCDQIETHFY